MMKVPTCLNPCCSGRWSRTWQTMVEQNVLIVLILVVVDDGLVRYLDQFCNFYGSVSLNPCCSGRWSRTSCSNSLVDALKSVLILVVVDDGLVLCQGCSNLTQAASLNPCCSGRWSRTERFRVMKNVVIGLNPCCSGRWSRTAYRVRNAPVGLVLILVVVDDGLVLYILVFFLALLRS